MIHIIDYGASNLFSLQNALKSLGRDSVLVSSPEQLAGAPALFFPGVGQFGYACARLDELNLRGAIGDFAASGKPFLGICLGMQLMFERSAEDKYEGRGLGIFSGSVETLEAEKIPHVGWNRVEWRQPAAWSRVEESPFAYFVHSFYCKPEDDGIVIGEAEYGRRFPCVVRRGAVTAMQFHPEKSGAFGVALLRAWLEDMGC